mmetsp:Transcript_14272/g.60386  ORF Transcript_14272/g.60386 Transcript_14272/m.60386 type:complete len:98 (-) Transcript_14272:1891-2184(-)
MRRMAPSKVLLFGGSGGTGRYVAKFALEVDHKVIAFVRNPAKLRSVLREVGVSPALVEKNFGEWTATSGSVDGEGGVRRESCSHLALITRLRQTKVV